MSLFSNISATDFGLQMNSNAIDLLAERGTTDGRQVTG